MGLVCLCAYCLIKKYKFTKIQKHLFFIFIIIVIAADFVGNETTSTNPVFWY
jgi:hypothetical protein